MQLSNAQWEWNQAKLHDLKVFDARPAARIPAQTNQLSDQTGAVHPNPNRNCWSHAKIIRPKVSFGSASVFYPKQRGKCHSCSAPNKQLFVYTYENPKFGRCSHLMCISSGCTCERCFFPKTLNEGYGPNLYPTALFSCSKCTYSYPTGPCRRVPWNLQRNQSY